MPPEEMTNRELVEACQPRPWEQRLRRWECLLAPALGLVLVYGNLFFLLKPDSLQFGLLIGVMGCFPFLGTSLMLVLLAHAASGLRTRKYARELERRCGQGPIEEYILQAQEALAARDAPDWVVLVQGRGLPHGDSYFIRLELWRSSPPRGRLEARTGHRFDLLEGDRPEIAISEAPLDSGECRDLLQQLEEAVFPLEDEDCGMRDGFPGAIALLRREPPLVSVGRANLYAPTGRSASLTVRLMRQVFELAEKGNRRLLTW